MTRLVRIALIVVAAAACSPAGPRGAAANDAGPGSNGMMDGAGYTVTVRDLGDGRFGVDYLLADAQSALIFSRSSGDYRVGAWSPVGSGVQLERLHGFDALLFDAPRTEFSLIVEPRFVSPPGDYSPYVGFSDGSLAIYTGQFEVLAVADTGSIAALDGNLGAWQGEQYTMGVRILSDRRMVFDGEIVDGSVEHTARGNGAFVYLGDGEITARRSYVGVLDRGLPTWVLEAMDDDMESIFETYETRWQHPLEERAVLYFAYGGGEQGGYSNKGSVIDRSILMSSSGQAMSEPSPDLRTYLRWFFAHEVAHQFQNLRGQGSGTIGESWIHEGGANTMATGLVAQMLGEAGPDYLSATYAREYAQCLPVLAAGPLETAHLRDQSGGFYACGALIGLVIDEATPDGDIYTVWLAMQALSEQRDEQRSRALFFEAAGQAGVDADLIAHLDRLIDGGADDPAAQLRRAMDMAGLAAEFDGNNQLITLQQP
ncbi:hypothetical protein AWH62_10195 [Maricaulis sp. W15]|uniref:hypothetical protein n=1 Tax=Maricaulis sp. W15 TaxID=1772333 RepID=UPI0009490806|nr:hypothetical protein [Maricaulis sp. W15]OLF72209.1 hypothetical protein AWH62_10195 [Maricaulis sp. W15]